MDLWQFYGGFGYAHIAAKARCGLTRIVAIYNSGAVTHSSGTAMNAELSLSID